MFSSTSRYAEIELMEFTMPDGRKVVCLRRRFVPPGSDSLTLAEHCIKADNRLDNVTSIYLADPLQFWRVADANDAMWPDDLVAKVREGKFLKIPLPERS